jgi:hypothetical protein
MIPSRTYPLTILALASLPLLAQAESTQTLPTLYVDAQQTANIRPVTTYESPVSNLEFEPRIDLQSRNMAEAQGDVSIRGGIFEGTGFRVGSATLIDPQTGHYSAELPIAPEMLTRPKILTGSDNALYGFNSTAGTISYGWSQIQDGGKLTIGGGDHDLNFQRIHHGLTGQLGESGEWSWGVEAEISRSESDGTINNGEHDFDRSTARVQILGADSQIDFFAGQQDKSFAWPGMYTGDNYNQTREYEDINTELFIFNYRREYSARENFEISLSHREFTDNYYLSGIVKRDTDYLDNNLSYYAEHVTRVSSISLNGFHEINEKIGIHYAGTIIDDSIPLTKTKYTEFDPLSGEIADSTAEDIANKYPPKRDFLGGLDVGKFQSRKYTKITLLPEYQFTLSKGEAITARAGASYDDSNRDGSEISFIGDISWKRLHDDKTEQIYLSYSKATQVPGYTAIGGSETAGIFKSNHDLGRESSQNLELGVSSEHTNWSLRGAIFYRWDNELTDWTYSSKDDTYARYANAVDLETYGVELIASKRWETIEAIASYTFMDKDEDYGDAEVDASFYALNYAKHRFTLGAIWTPSEIIQFRIDNEWRQNQENSLRLGSDSALFTHFGLSIYPPQLKNMELFFAVDNAWDDDFEDVPSTPGRGDQYSAGVTFSW